MAIFTNKATLSYNGRTTDSNTVTGNFVETLTVTKNALTETYTPGALLTYVVSIQNTGTSPTGALTVTDDLGAYETSAGTTVYPLTYREGTVAYYVNGVLQAAPTVVDTQPLTVSGITVPARGNVILLYQAEANGFAPPVADGAVVNTVTVLGAPCNDLTATATVTAVSEADLAITKALSPTTVPENGTLTYTFEILNTGNTEAVATDNVTVTDLFDPILTISSVTLNGVALEEGSGYTYNETTGLFSTVPSVITVPAAAFVQNADGSYTVVPGSVTLTVTGTI